MPADRGTSRKLHTPPPARPHLRVSPGRPPSRGHHTAPPSGAWTQALSRLTAAGITHHTAACANSLSKPWGGRSSALRKVSALVTEVPAGLPLSHRAALSLGSFWGGTRSKRGRAQVKLFSPKTPASNGVLSCHVQTQLCTLRPNSTLSYVTKTA